MPDSLAIASARSPDNPILLKPREVVCRELTADSESPRDGGRPGVLHSADREEDAHPDAPEVPVLLVEPVPLGLRFPSAGIIADVAVLAADHHELVPYEHVNVVPGRPKPETERADDGPEVVPREHQKVVINPPPGRVVEARPVLVGREGHEDKGAFRQKDAKRKGGLWLRKDG